MPPKPTRKSQHAAARAHIQQLFFPVCPALLRPNIRRIENSSRAALPALLPFFFVLQPKAERPVLLLECFPRQPFPDPVRAKGPDNLIKPVRPVGRLRVFLCGAEQPASVFSVVDVRTVEKRHSRTISSGVCAFGESFMAYRSATGPDLSCCHLRAALIYFS